MTSGLFPVVRRLSGLRRRVVDGASRFAAKRRPDAGFRPPAQRSFLDDIALHRPWNIAVKACRVVARLRTRSLKPGVTVVIVNWNTGRMVADVVRAVQHFSPTSTHILVCDNGSTDASVELLRKSRVRVL